MTDLKEDGRVKLLPCPFCGFDYADVELDYDHVFKGARPVVTCAACNAVGPVNWPSDDPPMTVEAVVKLWNTRASQDQSHG